MEVIKYTPETIVSVSQPYIRVCRNRAFAISRSACEIIGVKKGDKISIVFVKPENSNIRTSDGKIPGLEIFIVKEEKSGFTLSSSRENGSLNFYCNFLSNKILDTLKLNNNSYKMLVATLPTDIKKTNDKGFALFYSSAIK